MGATAQTGAITGLLAALVEVAVNIADGPAAFHWSGFSPTDERVLTDVHDLRWVTDLEAFIQRHIAQTA